MKKVTWETSKEKEKEEKKKEMDRLCYISNVTLRLDVSIWDYGNDPAGKLQFSEFCFASYTMCKYYI